MFFTYTSQVRSGTWMMTGNGVMHNGTTTVDDYGQNLDKLKVDTNKPWGTVQKSVCLYSCVPDRINIDSDL